jgi:hypothetical protein
MCYQTEVEITLSVKQGGLLVKWMAHYILKGVLLQGNLTNLVTKSHHVHIFLRLHPSAGFKPSFPTQAINTQSF